jgi:hypothetical protein
MTEAVLNHGRETVTSNGGGSGGISAGGARFTGNPKLSRVVVAPREGWMRRTVRAAASLARKSTQTSIARGTHQLCKGRVERAHLPRGGRICCQTGKVWITADGGGEDVILSRGEFRWFRAGVWLLIEAIAKSEIIVEA